MDKIRWYEHPEARQLASLGKRLSKAARGRLQWMLFYYFNGRNVARTCRHFGISRQTFYRWKRRFDRSGATGPRKPGLGDGWPSLRSLQGVGSLFAGLFFLCGHRTHAYIRRQQRVVRK